MATTTKITDLVPKETFEELSRLRSDMGLVVDEYVKTATELAKGLKIKIEVIGDLDKLSELVAKGMQAANQATQKATQIQSQYTTILGNTTNTISRQLMERERLNKQVREEYKDGSKVRQMVEDLSSDYTDHTRTLAKYELQLKENKKAQSELASELQKGKITEEQYINSQAELIAEQRELNLWKSQLQQMMKIEEKLNDSNAGSYNHLSQQLELLKKTYKELSDTQRESPMGQEMERSIQNLDAHLKDMSADLGEFQRNVGNYAIAGQNGVVATESLVAAIQQEAVTMKDVADQSKILEEARRMLDTSDKNYQENLEAINTKLEENRQKLLDVSDIVGVQARSIAEAEEQNKRLEEALRNIDVTAEGSKEKMAQYNEQIERNSAFIEENKKKHVDIEAILSKEATSVREAEEQNKILAEELKKVDLSSEGAQKRIEQYSEKIKKNKKIIEDNTEALKDNEKQNKALADQLLGLIGINSNFGSSLTSLETKGKVWDGLGLKVKAFGNTLKGLLANPWVLTFLGIAGVGAAVKWWYDYNKGLLEATKLTKNFTGETGPAMQHVRSEIQAVADHLGKDFKETISAANVLVQQFGISWDEATELMKQGVAAGADMNGNLLSNIERFGPALRDAGVSAQEFVAILANTRNGIFDEKGVSDILKGGTRLRAMTKQIAESLDAIGISSQQMQKDLTEGNITMLEAIRQVSQRLKELPENAQEVGNVIKNVFGRTAAEGGIKLIESLADVNTDLEDMIKQMGEWGDLQIKQMDAQAELNKAIASVFDLGEHGFESWIAKGKIFFAETLTNIIKKFVEVYNWFVRTYNQTVALRVGLAAIGGVFNTLFAVGKATFDLMIEGFRATAIAVKGLLEIFSGDLKKGWDTLSNSAEKSFQNIKNIIVNTGKDIGDSFGKGISDSIDSQLNEIDFEGNMRKQQALIKIQQEEERKKREEEERLKKLAEIRANQAKSDKEKKELEKQAKEQLKILQQIEESRIALIVNTHEKEMLTIRLNFRKKLEAIKGDGENETLLRLQLLQQMEKELADCEEKYQKELAKTNLVNRLASVKKGSKEELDLKLAQLQASQEAEIEAAEKSGADVLLIEAKYNEQRRKLREDFMKAQASRIMKEYQEEEEMRNRNLQTSLISIQENYTRRLKEAGNDTKEQEKIERDYQRRVTDLQTLYARTTAEESINAIEKILDSEELSAEMRLEWERKLSDAKIALAKAVADEHTEQVNRQIEDDDKLREERTANLQRWLNVASDAISAISDLASSLFDRQIGQIEALQDANEVAGEKEVARIDDMVEKQVITEEEGEARKRAAEAKTAKQNEELEKKKAALEYKQAVFQKATDMAQAGISTALAIINALNTKPFMPLGLAMAAIAGTMGAIQMATIAATPIPKYAEGTSFHKGGLAMVGDAGKHEVVMIDGAAYVTPNTPTLVDLPKGASVLPDVRMLEMTKQLQLVKNSDNLNVTVNNDTKRVEKGLDVVAQLIKAQTRQQRKQAYAQQYEIFKATRL